MDWPLLLASLPAAAAAGAWLFLRSERFGALPDKEERASFGRSLRWDGKSFRNSLPTPRMAEGTGTVRTFLEYAFAPRPYASPSRPLPSAVPIFDELARNVDRIIWLGHSSFFLQLGGVRVLIDPVLSGNAGPVSPSTRAFRGSDAVSPAELPSIDVLAISHDHWDHLDRETLLALRPRIKAVVCGLGTGAHLRRWGFAPSVIHEGDWGQTFRFGGLSVRLAEARHYSGRGFTLRQSLWCGFIFETSALRIFFSGDSGYGPHFSRIGEEDGPFDLALVECGQYDRRWPFIHMTPEQTAQAAEDLRARCLLPMHNSKFCIAYHGWREPLERVAAACMGRPFRILFPRIGEAVAPWDGIAPDQRWWQDAE